MTECRPGDVLIVGIPVESVFEDGIDVARDKLEAVMPGVDVHFLTSVTGVIVYRPAQVEPRCICGHERDRHEHYRAGTDCGSCGRVRCPRFRKARR